MEDAGVMLFRARTGIGLPSLLSTIHWPKRSRMASNLIAREAGKFSFHSIVQKIKMMNLCYT